MAGSIFNNSSKDQQQEVKQKVDTHSNVILNVVERQKDLESSMDNLKEKIELIDNNSVKNFKKYYNDMKSLRQDINQVKQDLESLTEQNKKISRQLQLMANKEDVTKLERYIDLWNPMDFVTREEMDEFREKIKHDIRGIIKDFLNE